MTPALLPGFHAHVHSETEEPCLLQSDQPYDFAHGMLVFGEGSESRKQIHQHYRPFAKRIKVEVEAEVVVPVQPGQRRHPLDRWALKRRRFLAHAWLWSNVRDLEIQFRMDLSGWRIEDYIAGKYALHRALKIEHEPREDLKFVSEVEQGGEDVLDSPFTRFGSDAGSMQREPVYGGYGLLDYERSDDAIGKW